MPKAVLIYASLTGCTEEAAKLLEKELEELGASVELIHAFEADVNKLLHYDIIFIGTYTYGAHGDLPDEMVDFYFDLKEIDLNNRVFGVFGSGDRIYEFYCKSVDDFDKQLEKSNGIRGSKPVKFELTPSSKAKNEIKKMAKDVIEKYNSTK